MATVKKTLGGKRPTTTKTGQDAPLIIGMSKPVTSMRDISQLIFGGRKLGKTSLCRHFPKAFFAMFEQGLKGMSVQTVVDEKGQTKILDWLSFKKLIMRFEKNHTGIDYVIVDTALKCYLASWKYTCRRLGISHPNELGWAEGWKKIEEEFAEWMDRLCNIHELGVIFITHSEYEKIETRKGGSYDKLGPDLDKRATRWVDGTCDIIARYYMDEEGQRWLRVEQTPEVSGGNRVFEAGKLMTKSGERIYRIPMGHSSKEAYDNYLKAFNGEQVETNFVEDEDDMYWTEETEEEEEEEEQPKLKPRRPKTRVGTSSVRLGPKVPRRAGTANKQPTRP